MVSGTNGRKASPAAKQTPRTPKCMATAPPHRELWKHPHDLALIAHPKTAPRQSSAA